MSIIAILRPLYSVRAGAARILGAAGWLYAEQAVGLIIQFSIGIWMIRSFSPEDYGRWGLIAAVLYIGSMLSRMGLDDILMRNIARDPLQAEAWLARGLTLRLGAVPVIAALAVASILLLRPGDTALGMMAIGGGVALLLRQAEIGEAYLRASMQLGKLAIARVSALLIGASIKAFLLLTDAPIEAFAFAVIADFGIAGLFIAGACWRSGVPLHLVTLGDGRATSIFREALPVWLSVVAVVVYQKLDVVFVGAMLSNSAVGIYSAAARISEALYYVPFVIMQAATPMLINSRARSRRLYDIRYRQVLQILVATMLIAGFVLTFTGHILIKMMFGAEYLAAADILRVHAWTGVVCGLGYASSLWLVIEGRTVAVLWRTTAGAVLSLVLMAIMTPMYGAVGTAAAILIAQLVAVTAVVWIIPGRSRIHAKALTRALTLQDIYLLSPRFLARPIPLRQPVPLASGGFGTNGDTSG